MIEILQIIAASWPIAIMFIAAVAGSVLLYLLRWFKQSDREDKALRSSQAVTVRPSHRDDD